MVVAHREQAAIAPGLIQALPRWALPASTRKVG